MRQFYFFTLLHVRTAFVWPILQTMDEKFFVRNVLAAKTVVARLTTNDDIYLAIAVIVFVVAFSLKIWLHRQLWPRHTQHKRKEKKKRNICLFKWARILYIPFGLWRFNRFFEHYLAQKLLTKCERNKTNVSEPMADACIYGEIAKTENRPPKMFGEHPTLESHPSTTMAHDLNRFETEKGRMSNG